MPSSRPIFFIPSQPVGGRCGAQPLGDDRAGQNHWCFVIEDVREELRKLQQNEFDPALTWAQHKDLWESVRGLVAKARMRALHISDDHTAEAKVIRGLILELRPFLEGARPVFGRRPRQLRLYYGEPAAEEHCLLALHLDTKESDASGLQEQDDAIDEALRRAEIWAQAA